MVNKQTSSKKDELLATARRLFMRHGIRRVSVTDICQEAGVSKMTFYKYFSNKADLARAFYLAAAERSRQEYRQIMDQDIPFAKKAEQLIQRKLHNTEGISYEFIKDVYQDDRLGLRELLEEKRQEALEEMLRDFEQAAQKGEIRKDIHPQFIAYFMKLMGNMAADEHLRSLYRTEQGLIMEMTRFFFYGLGIKDEN